MANFSITMPRGDIRKVQFIVTNDGSPYDVEFDDIYFTVKQAFNKTEYLFQKRKSRDEILELGDGAFQFVIDPSDTDGLKIASYVCDIEVVSLENEIKQTFTGTLKLTDEATHAANEG